jgi:GNAT superfamily N-acetyltransferase
MTIKILIADYQNTQHCDDLLNCLNAYALDPMGGGEALSDYTQQHLINALLKQNNVFSVLCYVNDEIAGLVNCVEGFSTFNARPLVNIHDVIVLKKFRGQKLTAEMFAKVESIAKEKNACKLTLEALEGNIIARNAYSKLGFAGYELDPEMGKAEFWQKKI